MWYYYILLTFFLSTLFITYAIYFAFLVRKKIGRFACCIDAQAFAEKYSVILLIKTTEKQLTYGPRSRDNVCKIFLFYNEFKMIFHPVILSRLTAIDKDEYRDYFYESLEFITQRKKDAIIRDVKWYFLLNFFRMSSFYRTLFNIPFFRPLLPFIPQNNLCDPDMIMNYVPNHLKIGTKLSLVEIDSFPRYYINSLNANKCNKKARDPSNQLGSDRIGKCNLHALDHKLSPLFAADIRQRYSRSRSNLRIILYYKPNSGLRYYTTLYYHQYTLLKFARKIDCVKDEMLFLSCFNKAKCEQNQGMDKTDVLIALLQNEWNLFCRDTQIYLYRNQSDLHSLMQD